jgi:dTDP-4-dehydrorhamnose 3,5-epimerase
MNFRETELPGVFEVRLEPKPDERGYFARTWCQQEFTAHGLSSNIVQCNTSFNLKKGTLRGMHYQQEPNAEIKLIRCTRGKIFDVVLDLRPQSPAFKKWTSLILSSSSQNMIYIPEGFAHGFLTMEDDTEVFYQMSESHSAESARGVRWNDPAFKIDWPEEVVVISERDRSYPNFVSNV